MIAYGGHGAKGAFATLRSYEVSPGPFASGFAKIRPRLDAGV
jgi:hypothetical protein